VCRFPVRLSRFHLVVYCGYHCRRPRCYYPFLPLNLMTSAVLVHLGAVVLELQGCRMGLVLLFPILRCLLVCTYRPFRRSLGICSMTSALLFCCSVGVSMLFWHLQSGPSLFVVSHVLYGDAVVVDFLSQSASGGALCCLHRPGEWVWWRVLGKV
jgi:hypothetical protein